MRFAGPAATQGAALCSSAFNCGIAAGSWIAGLALDSSLGLTGPALVGAIIAALTLAPLMLLTLAPAAAEVDPIHSGAEAHAAPALSRMSA